MRITNNMLVNNMMYNLANNLTRTEKYQMQLATGKKISKPSDDPIIAAKALRLRTDVSEIEQHEKNTDDAIAWMDMTEATLSQMNEVMQRFREITNQAANGTNTEDDLQKIKAEVSQLKSQMTHLANATYAGRYIFSGYKTDKELMDEDGNFLLDVENSEQIQFEIGVGDLVNVNVLGGDLFLNGTSAEVGDKSTMIETFDTVLNAMEIDDKDSISSALSTIDNDITNMLRVRADLGARYNRVELTATRLGEDYVNTTGLMSKNEDVDFAESIMNLSNERAVYQASLATSANVIQQSLVDFI